MTATLATLVLAVAYLAASCAQSNSFQGSSTKKVTEPAVVPTPTATSAEAHPAASASPPPTIGEPKKDTFPITFTRRKLDIVWAIDNSVSMNEEAAQVRANFGKFITGLAADLDLKLALMSQITGPTAVTLDQDAVSKGHLQLNTPVGSSNALAILAAAGCPEKDTSFNALPNPAVGSVTTIANELLVYSQFTPLSICGRPFEQKDPFDKFSPTRHYLMESPEVVVSSRGRLAGFFRPDATRVYVIVTDDDAGMVNETNFIDMVMPSANNRRPFVFSFRGIENTGVGCAVAMHGRSYESLATKTGAEVYDICLPDWSVHFKKLAESLQKIANNQFDLSDPKAAIAEVKIDGVALPAEKWRVEGGKLVIDKSAIPDGAKEILVTYKTK